VPDDAEPEEGTSTMHPPRDRTAIEVRRIRGMMVFMVVGAGVAVVWLGIETARPSTAPAIPIRLKQGGT
jgi:hypothetical protein